MNYTLRSCKKKKRYSSREAAQAAAIMESIRCWKDDFYIYKCSECNGFHLTSDKNEYGDQKFWAFNFSRNGVYTETV